METAAIRTPLSRERVTTAALLLIDADGLDALSMRKLGAALGVEAMSLYNHVRNKDDLLGAVTDNICAEILLRFDATSATPRTSDPVTWQSRATAMAYAYWTVSREHPRAFPLVSYKPIDSMNGMMMLARCLEIFTDAGLALDDAAAAFNAAAGWLLGTIEQEHRLMGKLVEGGGILGRVEVALENHRPSYAYLADLVWPAHPTIEADDADLGVIERVAVGGEDVVRIVHR